jgi:hypothetical protein
VSEYSAWAVTASAITPDTPRHALENPGIAVYDGRNEIVGWHSAPTGWEITDAGGTIDEAAATKLLASMGWALEPESRWLASSKPGCYLARVTRAEAT